MESINHFYVIPQLRLDEGRLKCRPNGKRSLREVHFKQGELDGACGVYSFLMALAILGVFEPDKLLSDTLGGLNSAEKTLVRELNKHGLYRKGLTGKDVKAILEKAFNPKIEVGYHLNKDDDETAQEIIDHLDGACPVILGLVNKKSDFSHWVLAVGYQSNDLDEVSAFLILDPSSSVPRISYWNAILTLSDNESEYRYVTEYITEGNRNVILDDAVFISRKPNRKKCGTPPPRM